MADLDSLQSTDTIKIVGSTSLGVETTPIKSSLNGDLGVSDSVDNGGVSGAISVSTTAIAVRASSSNLTNRKNLTFYNNGTQTLYWGYSSGVTPSTGIPLMVGQFVSGDWGPNTTIYLIAGSGSHNVRVAEGA